MPILPRRRKRRENEVSNEQQIDEAIASLEQAMKALRDLGLITEGEEDE
jgi:hypothetical protein